MVCLFPFLPRWWWPDWSVSASKKLEATVSLHPPRHPPNRETHTLPSVSGGAHVTCHMRSPGLSLPPSSPSLPSPPGFSLSGFSRKLLRLSVFTFTVHQVFENLFYLLSPPNPAAACAAAAVCRGSQRSQKPPQRSCRDVHTHQVEHKEGTEKQKGLNQMKRKKMRQIDVAFMDRKATECISVDSVCLSFASLKFVWLTAHLRFVRTRGFGPAKPPPSLTTR